DPELGEMPGSHWRPRHPDPPLAERRVELAGACAPGAGRDLVPHRARDDDDAIEPAQQIEASGGGEADERARVRDDGSVLHDAVNLRRWRRRAPRTARSDWPPPVRGSRAAPAPR